MICALAMLLMAGCSTTRVLTEGERRLTQNQIEIDNAEKNGLKSDDLMPYLKQPVQNWSPFLCIYNWQTGKNEEWDDFVRKLGSAPEVFDSSLVASSVANISNHLKYLGYYGSTVSAEVKKKPHKKVSVKYNVHLGKRYPINSITYEIHPYGDFHRDFIADTSNTTIRKGAFMSEEILEQETSRAADVMRNKGYYDFTKNYFFFEADTVSVPSQAKLRIIVKQHARGETDNSNINFEKYKLGKISVRYPDDLMFRTSVLKDLNTLKTGETYSLDNINVAYSRLNNVSLFKTVGIELTPDEKNHTVDCAINLQKGKTQGFKLGLQGSVNSTGLFGIVPELNYYHRNIFHGGEILNIALSTNHQFMMDDRSIRSNEVSASASLIIPRFLPFPITAIRGSNIPTTEFKVSYNYQNRPEFQRNIFSGSLNYTGNINRHFFYQIAPVNINLVKMPFIAPDFENTISVNPFLANAFIDHLDMGAQMNLQYSSSMSPNPKESYWYTRLQFNLSGNLFSFFNGLLNINEDGSFCVAGTPYSQYVRGELTLGRTFVWGDDAQQSLAMRLLGGAGYAYGNSKSLPFENHFYSGGANSLRGWTARTVGPGNSAMNNSWIIPNQSGDMKLEANLEYRFNMFWRIYGALFVDAGNIWNIERLDDFDDFTSSYFSLKTLPQSIAADWGAGIRFDFSFFILRVDYGMRFRDPARVEGDRWLGPAQWFQKGNYAFHFAVGYPF